MFSLLIHLTIIFLDKSMMCFVFKCQKIMKTVLFFKVPTARGDAFKLLVIFDKQSKHKEKQQILTFEKIEPEKVWHFCLKKTKIMYQ